MLVISLNEELEVLKVFDQHGILGADCSSLLGLHITHLCPSLSQALAADTAVEGQLYEFITQNGINKSVGLFATVPTPTGRSLFFQDTTDISMFGERSPFSTNTTILQVSSVGRIEFVARHSPTLLNCDPSTLVGQSFMRFVANDDLPQFCRKVADITKCGVASFSVKMLRKPSDDCEFTSEAELAEDVVEVDIWGRVCNGAFFMVLMEQEDGRQVCEQEASQVAAETAAPSTTWRAMARSDAIGQTVAKLRTAVHSVLAARTYVVQVVFMLQVLSELFYDVSGTVSNRAGKLATGILATAYSVAHKQYLTVFPGQSPVAC